MSITKNDIDSSPDSSPIWDTFLAKLTNDPLSDLFFFGVSERIFVNHGKKSANVRFAINHLLFEETCDAENIVQCKDYVATQVANHFGIQDVEEFTDYSLEHILCGSSFGGFGVRQGDVSISHPANPETIQIRTKWRLKLARAGCL